MDSRRRIHGALPRKRSRCSRADSAEYSRQRRARVRGRDLRVDALVSSRPGRSRDACRAFRSARHGTDHGRAHADAGVSIHAHQSERPQGIRCAVRRAAFSFHARHTLRRRTLVTRRPPWSTDQPKHAEVAGQRAAVVGVRDAGRAEAAAAGGASIEIACVPAADASSVRPDHARHRRRRAALSRTRRPCWP